jgi:hypothetical protein
MLRAAFTSILVLVFALSCAPKRALVDTPPPEPPSESTPSKSGSPPSEGGRYLEFNIKATEAELQLQREESKNSEKNSPEAESEKKQELQSKLMRLREQKEKLQVKKKATIEMEESPQTTEKASNEWTTHFEKPARTEPELEKAAMDADAGLRSPASSGIPEAPTLSLPIGAQANGKSRLARR